MEIELIQNVLAGVQPDTEIRIKVGDKNYSVGIKRLEIVAGVAYLVMQDDQRIIPKR